MSRNFAAHRTASLAVFLALTACDGGRTTPPPTEQPAKLPKITRFSSDRGAVPSGERVNLSWAVTDADSVEILPGVLGEQATLEGVVESPPITAAVTFTLRARSPAGEDSRQVSITIATASTAPTIESFTATPPVVASGAQSTLAWQVVRADRVRLELSTGGVLVAEALPNGSLPVMPLETTSYVLIAEGRGQRVQQTVQVVVGKLPMITAFTAAPEEVVAGGTAELAWDVADADSVRVLEPSGRVVTESMDDQGRISVQPTATTEYRLEAINTVGTVDTRATVRVMGSNPPTIDEFSVTPLTLLGPGDVTVRWSAPQANTVSLFLAGSMVPGFRGTPSGETTVTITQTAELELRASNPSGEDIERATVTVMPLPDSTPPSITHTPITLAQTAGAAIAIDATVTDADSGVAEVTLFYRASGAMAYDMVALTAGTPFRGQIPAASVMAPGVEYYLEARDNAGNRVSLPATAPATGFIVPVMTLDTTAPVITHTPVANGQLVGMPVTVAATIVDAGSGIGAASLFYRLAGAPSFQTRTMMALPNDRFSADIPAAAVVAGTLEYYIQAVDGASPANTALSPATAPGTVHSFTVSPVDGTAPVISHTPIADGQTANGALTVSANVTDASGVASVTLHHRRQGTPTFTQVTMTGAGGNYSAAIPAATVQTPGVEYYIQAVDAATPSNTRVAPMGAPGTPYAFTVAMADTNPPQITHTQVTSPRAPGVAVNVSATITDASGVSTAQLLYRRVGGASFTTVPMTGGPTFVATIPANEIEPPGIEYYLRAVDGASAMNAGTSPAAAPGTTFSFTIGVSENEPNESALTATVLVSGRTSNRGIGAITPTGDRDFWTVDIPNGAQRYSIRAEITSGGPGLCPSPIATVLRLYGSDGTTQLASDTFDGVGSCSLLDPATDTGARALAGGRYYLRVEESGENASIAAYELTVTLVPTACGNNILETAANEQCEDGNTTNGDGCSSTCTIEPEGVITPPTGLLSGDISPAADVDIYAVDVTGTMYLRAEVTDAAGTGCPGDVVLDLLAPDGITQLGTDDDDGNGTCPLINPIVDSFARGLTTGRYYLRVRGVNATTTAIGYRLRVSATPNLCGNGALEAPEQCDDSNTTAADGCSATCQFETVGTAMGMGASFSDAITPIRNVDYYAVVVTQGQSIRAETFAPTAGLCSAGNDTVIRLWNSTRTTQIVSADQGGIGACSLLDPASNLSVRNLAAGTYYVSVEDYQNNGTIAAYVLDIQIRNPGCGNGWLDGADQCDDGNTMSGDGSSSTCQYEGAAEAEPNNSSATATVLRGAADPLETSRWGSLSTTTDLDYYSIVVPANHSVFAEVSDGNMGCPNNAELRLYGTNGTTSLVLDTADGPGNCGQIAPVRDTAARFLAAGTYYLRVSGTGGSAIYQVMVRIVPPSCGDNFLTGAETCDDGNAVSGDGCSATCTIEGNAEVEPNNTAATATPVLTGTVTARSVRGVLSSTTDVDAFRITVPAGHHVIADVSDGRGRCPNGASVRLRSPSGTSLVTDNVDGTDGCGRIAPGLDSAARNLTSGDYVVEVFTAATSVAPVVYQLDLRVVPATTCGNLYQEGSETCDDGNTVSGDGCSATCAWEGGETEPNQTFTTATPVTVRVINGAITSGDVDWYSIAVPGGASLTIRTFTGGPDQCATGTDTIITLFGPDGTTQIADDDDDSGAGTCSVIEASEASNLAAGTYYLRVTPYNSGTFPTYGLDVWIR